MTGPTSFVFYRYQPSMVAAVIFIGGFAISTLLHLKTLVQKRTWYFIPFILGCLCEYIAGLDQTGEVRAVTSQFAAPSHNYST